MWNLSIRPRMISSLALLFLANIANANLVLNGDFESGDQDFITDYTLGIGDAAQRYNITKDPKLHHPGATSYSDHTSGSGNMMAINAAAVANQLIWGQEISLAANTNYKFSIWVSSWTSSTPANLVFAIGGISLGSLVAPSQTGTWVQHSFVFNSNATSGLVSLSIIDTTSAGSGDDFAIDDISLTAVDCTSTTSTVSPNLNIHIPSATFGSSNIWIDLEYNGTSGFDHLWKLQNYGSN